MKVVLKDGVNAGTFFIEFKRELRKKNNTIVTSCVISQVEVDPFGRTSGLPVSPDHVWRGIARQEPRDKFDKKLGRIIALDRALDNAEMELQPSPEDVIKYQQFDAKTLLPADDPETFKKYQKHKYTLPPWTTKIFSHQDRQFFRQYNDHIARTTIAGSYRGPKKDRVGAPVALDENREISSMTTRPSSEEDIPF